MSLFSDIIPINKNEEKKSTSANLSPYLNFDPHYIPKMQPEFLYPDESHMASTARRSNVALPIIGMSFMSGSGLGGMAGLYKGLRATTLAGQTGKVRRTQLINYVMKQGTTTGCTLGILASFYSSIALGVTWLRDKEDTANTFIAATATGILYKSTAGLRSMGLGAAAGITLAGLYTLITDNDNIWSKARYIRM
ncbi:mitochondrial import inner membrane translocase subunit Tim23 [Vanessa tameamea]|uniref:Mitochondrial import inner membrane translocase subunit Tim23 n=1 Tax=Vanessa tameamea TaxID=334116 RepID=A0A8B8I1X4_VANTA|nr:mitochondrial import inner membrane translocase subunit Tim23 [Vanessa tameamea]XP_047540074.1 mitochondrial import inner membrane translocase subunit Tim23 [Vanessa atalanta]